MSRSRTGAVRWVSLRSTILQATGEGPVGWVERSETHQANITRILRSSLLHPLAADQQHERGGDEAGDAGGVERRQISVEHGAAEAGAKGRHRGADLVRGEHPAEDDGGALAAE